MTDTTDPARDFNERVLSARWTAVVNDEIGGWAVSTDGRTPAAGGRMAADMVHTREIGEHIAALHNAALGNDLAPVIAHQWSVRYPDGFVDGNQFTEAGARQRAAELGGEVVYRPVGEWTAVEAKP